MSARDPLRAAIAMVVREEIATARTEAPAWEWISCSALDMSSRSALRLARRERLRATRIAGRVYLHRVDLDALAARGAIVIASHAAIEDDDGREAAERVFGVGATR